jgi:hypothetical protein
MDMGGWVLIGLGALGAAIALYHRMVRRGQVAPEDDEAVRLAQAKEQDRTYTTPSGSGG